MTATLNALSTILTPNLDVGGRNKLLHALGQALLGKRVTIAVRYQKVTNSKPRIAGVDYKPRLAHGADILEGTIADVKQGKNGWYVLLDATLTRQPLDDAGKVDKTRIGWTAIKGPGIHAVLGLEIEEGLPPAQ